MTTTRPAAPGSSTRASTCAAIASGGISGGRSAGGRADTSCTARGSAIHPGTTQATRTPNRSSQSDSAVVSRIRPALATACSGEPYAPMPRPALDEIETAAPIGEFDSGARSRWSSRNGERRFSVSTASQSASSASG